MAGSNGYTRKLGRSKVAQEEPFLPSGLFQESVLGLLDAFEEVDETIVRDFRSDRLFPSVVDEPLFEKNRLCCFRDEIAVRRKLDITRAVMGLNTFADQCCILAHDKKLCEPVSGGSMVRGFFLLGTNGKSPE